MNNNALQITGGYIGENVSSGIASGTVYISYLVNMPASPTATLSGLEMNTSGNGMFVGITASGGTGAGYLGVNQQCSYGDACASKWQSSTANITYGSTYFIVVKRRRQRFRLDGQNLGQSDGWHEFRTGGDRDVYHAPIYYQRLLNCEPRWRQHEIR